MPFEELLLFAGVSGDAGETKKLSVLEGDSVTLHSNLTEIHKIDLMMWMYGSQGSIIAKLNGKSQLISLYDVDDGRFGDRLQLDIQTGSLTICDIRTKHTGDYQLRIISSETSFRTFSLTVHGEQLTSNHFIALLSVCTNSYIIACLNTRF